MTRLRHRLPVLAILVTAAQLLTLGLSVSAVWVYTDMHHDMVAPAECHMPPMATMCPMHHTSDQRSPSKTGTTHGSSSALFRCHCSSTLRIDGLVGVAGVMTAPARTALDFALAGLTIVLDSAPLELDLQVSSPPPRL